jgi:hypothetical protein
MRPHLLLEPTIHGQVNLDWSLRLIGVVPMGKRGMLWKPLQEAGGLV